MTLIDTNAILRFFLNDIKEQHDKAVSVIKAGAFTTPEVLAEVTYVLTGFYEETRENVADSIAKLLIDVHIEHKEAVMEAIKLYHDTSLDFVDCVLIGRNHVLGDDVFSFDKKLNKRLIFVDGEGTPEEQDATGRCVPTED